jgi:hypothetical protein
VFIAHGLMGQCARSVCVCVCVHTACGDDRANAKFTTPWRSIWAECTKTCFCCVRHLCGLWAASVMHRQSSPFTATCSFFFFSVHTALSCPPYLPCTEKGVFGDCDRAISLSPFTLFILRSKANRTSIKGSSWMPFNGLVGHL